MHAGVNSVLSAVDKQVTGSLLHEMDTAFCICGARLIDLKDRTAQTSSPFPQIPLLAFLQCFLPFSHASSFPLCTCWCRDWTLDLMKLRQALFH